MKIDNYLFYIIKYYIIFLIYKILKYYNKNINITTFFDNIILLQANIVIFIIYPIYFYIKNK